MSIFDRLLEAGGQAARAASAAGRAAADAAMQQPTVRRRLDGVRQRIEEARVVAEKRLGEVERDLWTWINKMQEEAHRAQRQVVRARSADDYYAVLDLGSGADLRAVKKAYHRKMRANHPDKFAHDPTAERAAHARAQEINEAYQQLTALLTGRESRTS